MENFQKNLGKLINNQVNLTNRTPFVKLNPLSRNPGIAPGMFISDTMITFGKKIIIKIQTTAVTLESKVKVLLVIKRTPLSFVD